VAEVEVVNPDIDGYALAHTTPEKPPMQELAREAQATLPSPQMLSGLVVGRLLEMLVWSLQPRLVLEIGTYAGYSALSMAAALPPGGHIVTCEISESHAEFARRHIAASPHAERVEVRVGPALDTIATLDGPLDLVFIDAEKTGYRDYYEAVLPKLAPHGLIAVDNTLQGGGVLDGDGAGSDSTRAIVEFNELVAGDERVNCVLLTVRDGVTLIRRR
jgi:caffeoyl-CoA O-methyltransferase